MSEDQKKVLEKIQKLLALGKSPNQHEAASAVAKAQMLMQTHNVSLNDVEGAGLTHMTVKSPFSSTKPKNYEAVLANVICRGFGCSIVFLRAAPNSDDIYARYCFIGRKSDVEMAVYLFTVLQRGMSAGRAAFVKELPKSYTAKDKTMEGDGFCLGYAIAVKKAVAEIACPISDTVMIEYAKKTFGEGGVVKPQERKLGASGYAAGQAAGAKEKVYRPMEGASQEMIGAA